MSRRVAPHNARFWSIPARFDGGALYVAELASGVIKVGCSECPRHRLVLLSHEAKREHGTDISRFHVGHPLGRRSRYHVETSLIRKMQDIGQPVDGRREYFSGVPFEVAVALLSEVGAA